MKHSLLACALLSYVLSVDAAPVAVHQLRTISPACYARSGLVAGPDGYFYGSIVIDGNALGIHGGAIYRVSPAGEDFKVIYRFAKFANRPEGPVTGGSGVWSNLLAGADGTLYGLNGGNPGGSFLLFSLTPTGVYSIVREFPHSVYPYLESRSADGEFLALIDDSTDTRIVTFTGNGPLTEHGKLRSWPRYDEQFTDHTEPRSVTSAFRASDGQIYGTTFLGGNFEWDPPHPFLPPSGSSWGTVFRLESDGSATIVMKGARNCSNPSKLIEAPGGGFYVLCPAPIEPDGGAVAFIPKQGAPRVIKTFNDAREGKRPSSLSLGLDGNLYGTATECGLLPGGREAAGTVFRLTPAGAVTVLATLDLRFTGYSSISGLDRLGNFFWVPKYRFNVTQERRDPPPPPPTFPTAPLARADTRVFRYEPRQGPRDIVIRVLGNDRACDGGPLRVLHVSTPEHGLAWWNEDHQAVVYRPRGGKRTDSFAYTCADAAGRTSLAQVLIRRSAAKNYSAHFTSDDGQLTGHLAIAMNMLGQFRATLTFPKPRVVYGQLGVDDTFSITVPSPEGDARLSFRLDESGAQRLLGQIEKSGSTAAFIAQ